MSERDSAGRHFGLIVLTMVSLVLTWPALAQADKSAAPPGKAAGAPGKAAGAPGKSGSGRSAVFEGYVFDSACLFTKDLKRPISAQCARDCAAGGSPLVIMGDDGVVYWPVDSKMPAVSQNSRLLEFGGQYVRVRGTVYSKGGSKAVVIEKVEKATPPRAKA